MVSSIGQVIHNSKTTNSINSTKKSNLTSTNLLSTNSINSLIENNKIDYSSLIEPALVPVNWTERHFKVIHKVGPNAYLDMVHRAKKYGRNPQALLCSLVSKALTAGA